MRHTVRVGVCLLVMALLAASPVAAKEIFRGEDRTLSSSTQYVNDWWLEEQANKDVTLTCEVRVFGFNATPYYVGIVRWPAGSHGAWADALKKGVGMAAGFKGTVEVAKWPGNALTIVLKATDEGGVVLEHNFGAFPPDKVRPIRLGVEEAKGVIKALESVR